MSVENIFFFTHQVDQFFVYIHEAKTIFQFFFTNDLLVNSSRYLSEKTPCRAQTLQKEISINQYKHIYLPPISCVAWNKFSNINELFCNYKYRIGGIMVSVLALNAVDCGFDSRSGQTKDYKIGICCFSLST